MRKEQDRYIYDEKESEETARLISAAYESGYVGMEEASAPSEN
ncbi:hypothetical protein OTK50_09180 [Bacillus sp. NEAU-CP5]|nr:MULTISPECIES: hypothetical protein [Bacillus]MCX3305390.1 hypothetical protein [Bacillus velezensis]MCX8439990.1 hypothetical protein [Bacillus sp. NEAU-CP5]MEB4594741.1 hypothetical protein [Bacillus amyloliquefaciens]MEC1337411.1 hypothetical protein [Bacillus velezensis]WJF82608.1 hypothetical protein QRA13_18180 [Bacillus velezensis]